MSVDRYYGVKIVLKRTQRVSEIISKLITQIS